MNYGKTHQDMMDPTRTVVPQSSDGKNLKCRVYFDGDFAGVTDIPISLFVGTRADQRLPERVGFVLVNDKPAEEYQENFK